MMNKKDQKRHMAYEALVLLGMLALLTFYMPAMAHPVTDYSRYFCSSDKTAFSFVQKD